MPNSKGFVIAVSRVMKPVLKGIDYTLANINELSKSFKYLSRSKSKVGFILASSSLI